MLIDDDPAMVFSLRSFIEQTPFLNLVAAHQAPYEALKTLQDANVQLIFMDIGLPEISGIELSRLISVHNNPAPRIIFITSHEEFAMDGYKVKALDYLLKPLSYDTFLAAAFRAKDELEGGPRLYADTDYLFLRAEYELRKIYLKNILYLEGFRDYVKVYLAGQGTFIKALITMKSLEEKLPADSFIRIHRSFIVSVDKIDSISRTTVRIGKAVIPVSEQYKDNFREFTGKWF